MEKESKGQSSDSNLDDNPSWEEVDGAVDRLQQDVAEHRDQLRRANSKARRLRGGTIAVQIAEELAQVRKSYPLSTENTQVTL